MKSKLLFVVVALVSFVLGAFGMAGWCWYAYTRWVIQPKEVEMASWAARDTVALAHLRLNEPEKAIRALENGIDEVVSSLSLWDEESPPKETTRTARDRWLRSVKVYHESYPACGEGAERVNRLLSQVPGRSSASTCKTSICRLDDLHRAAVKADTNSAATNAPSNEREKEFLANPCCQTTYALVGHEKEAAVPMILATLDRFAGETNAQTRCLIIQGALYDHKVCTNINFAAIIRRGTNDPSLVVRSKTTNMVGRATSAGVTH